MITRVLVANRGEIASRVFATCRRLGISTVAVHSDADAGLPYVREADVAVRLVGDAAADTYLRADLILDAALRTGADAIHPGYGFLSENAGFARAVIDAGVTWVGPSPESIEQMGSKVAAKALMVAAGVPVLTDHTPASAAEADLPLIVKASAGGGGRGMRVVRALSDLPAEMALASAEAASAFGDGTVFVETYVERSRHVEVQVVGHAGGILVLGERDCSVQRRHQKVIEESPAPLLSETIRTAMHEAARSAAAAIDYRGAGTVEFLYDPEGPGRFFFLEMNTRLQVEHPVTELVHGADLVDLQFAVAEGRSLDPSAVGERYGHAVEARLYAEDTDHDWQPQSGDITTFDIPGVEVAFDLLNRPGVRVDAGYEAGTAVSTHYDAMLAKVIAWAPTREQATRRLADTLRRARLHGVLTNRDQLLRTLVSHDFVTGRVSTALLEREPDWTMSWPSTRVRPEAVGAALALAERSRLTRTVQREIPVAWRNVVSQPQTTSFEGVDVAWQGGRNGYVVDGYTVVAAGAEAVTLEHDGVRSTYRVAVNGLVVDVDSPRGHLRLVRVPRFVDPADAVASGSLLAPMPGTVVRVAVEAGQQVTAGQLVLVLEAMKMQHTVTAPTDGRLTRIDVTPGSQVAAGEVLAIVEEHPVEEQE